VASGLRFAVTLAALRMDQSDSDTMTDLRFNYLQRWLSSALPGRAFELAPASADASFRRYFRVSFAGGDEHASLIAMDAPPTQEDCRPFVAIARLFGAAGMHVPQVLAQDLEQGFLLLSDLGTTTYLDALDEGSADALYRDALSALVGLQAASSEAVLPDYDRAALEREIRLFPEWYVSRQLKRELSPQSRAGIEDAFERLLANNLAQPRVYVHRDYHSRNLMVCTPNPGVLDFQDAVYGPITYDLASLLRDAYINWEEQQIIDWCIRYWEMARKRALPVAEQFGDFYRDFEWMGAQRQLKVLGIFARLAYRDGKQQYLADQPRVMRYLRFTCARYRELVPLAHVLDELENHAAQSGYTF